MTSLMHPNKFSVKKTAVLAMLFLLGFSSDNNQVEANNLRLLEGVKHESEKDYQSEHKNDHHKGDHKKKKDDKHNKPHKEEHKVDHEHPPKMGAPTDKQEVKKEEPAPPPPPPEPKKEEPAPEPPKPKKKQSDEIKLEESKLEKGVDTEGYFAGKQKDQKEVAAGDGTIVAPTHANPSHAPKQPPKKPDVPKFEDSGFLKKGLQVPDDGIRLTPDNQKKVIILASAALFVGICTACLCKCCSDKKPTPKHQKLRDEDH